MTLALIILATEVLKLVNLLLEGETVSQRQARAYAWWIGWWPLSRGWLKLWGAKEEDLKQVEEIIRQGPTGAPK